MKANARMNVELDKELYKSIKHHCIEHDIRINKFVESILKEYIDNIPTVNKSE